MATWYTDFSEYTVDVQPSDWSTRGATTSSTFVVYDDGGNKVLRHDGTSAYRALVWDTVGAIGKSGVQEINIAAKFRIVGTLAANSQRFSVIGRCDASALTAYAGDVTVSGAATANVRSGEFTAGTLSATVNTSVSISASTWYWIRINILNDVTETKFWVDGEAEPGSYTQTRTDATLTAAGYVGVAGYTITAGHVIDIDRFGVGTDGTPAPLTAPIQYTSPTTSLTITSYNPSLSVVTAPTASLTLTAQVPAAEIGWPVGTETLSISTIAPTTYLSATPPSLSLALTPYAPSVTVFTAPVASLSLTPYAPLPYGFVELDPVTITSTAQTPTGLVTASIPYTALTITDYDPGFYRWKPAIGNSFSLLPTSVSSSEMWMGVDGSTTLGTTTTSSTIEVLYGSHTASATTPVPTTSGTTTYTIYLIGDTTE